VTTNIPLLTRPTSRSIGQGKTVPVQHLKPAVKARGCLKKCEMPCLFLNF
jgi:hypothetical protein